MTKIRRKRNSLKLGWKEITPQNLVKLISEIDELYGGTFPIIFKTEDKEYEVTVEENHENECYDMVFYTIVGNERDEQYRFDIDCTFNEIQTNFSELIGQDWMNKSFKLDCTHSCAGEGEFEKIIKLKKYAV